MAKALPRGAILLLALFPFLSGAFCPRASLGHLPLAASPVLSSRIGRLATSGPIVRSARILATKLSWQDKFAIQVPEKAWGHERIAIAKTVAIQEEALSPAESPAAKGAGSTVNAARIGQDS
ncbi:hypothetical protein T484DRAFT_1798338 [Baffinella frigidus]|nr:hypothetical protein T484DRAFT_1798338 [Cryptophyta sp. CCMP2293]